MPHLAKLLKKPFDGYNQPSDLKNGGKLRIFRFNFYTDIYSFLNSLIEQGRYSGTIHQQMPAFLIELLIGFQEQYLRYDG
jgi:hypothetical protein